MEQSNRSEMKSSSQNFNVIKSALNREAIEDLKNLVLDLEILHELESDQFLTTTFTQKTDDRFSGNH